MLNSREPPRYSEASPVVGGEGQFKSRIAALRERGFDVEIPTGDMASEQMLRLEEQADRAAKVRARVLDLPEHRHEDRQRFLGQLQFALGIIPYPYTDKSLSEKETSLE